jgi:hypothetical protein
MIRLLIGLLPTAVIIGIIALVVNYKTIYPCEMLAQDMASESSVPFASSFVHLVTDRYTQKECVVKLKDRWLGLDS